MVAQIEEASLLQGAAADENPGLADDVEAHQVGQRPMAKAHDIERVPGGVNGAHIAEDQRGLGVSGKGIHSSLDGSRSIEII